MTRNRPKWFRVEVDIEGKVLSARLADPPHEDGGLVFYVQARDLEQAEKKAHARYLYAMTCARRAQYERQGLCRCGNKRDAGGKRCSWCLGLGRAYKKRKDAGEAAPPRREVMAARRDAQDEAIRAETLRQVHRFALIARTMPEFLQWLRAELEKSGKAAA